MFFGKKPGPATPPTPPEAAASPPSPAAPTQAAPSSAAVASATVPPASAKAPELSTEEAQKRYAQSKKMAASFGELVLLLMQAPNERKLAIQDLDWLIGPAMMTGQFAIAEAQAKDSGLVTPVAGVLWALVSPEVDSRLSDTTNANVRLTPEEWRSGSIPWITLATGDPKIWLNLVEKLSVPVFKGQTPKVRLYTSDGKVSIGKVGPNPNANTG